MCRVGFRSVPDPGIHNFILCFAQCSLLPRHMFRNIQREGRRTTEHTSKLYWVPKYLYPGDSSSQIPKQICKDTEKESFWCSGREPCRYLHHSVVVSLISLVLIHSIYISLPGNSVSVAHPYISPKGTHTYPGTQSSRELTLFRNMPEFMFAYRPTSSVLSRAPNLTSADMAFPSIGPTGII